MKAKNFRKKKSRLKMEVKDQDHEEIETPSLGYNQQPNNIRASNHHHHQTFIHGNVILNPPPQTLDQNNIPLQYSLRPRISDHHPDQTLDPTTAAATVTATASSVRYRECLKNHAAKNGGHVLDGCGEFMPSGDDNTPESYKCAACECHRNFHRREEPESAEAAAEHRHSLTYYYNYHNSVAAAAAAAPASHFNYRHNQQVPVVGPAAPVMMRFGGGAVESSSEDLEMYHNETAGEGSRKKRRFRTKFNEEQKMKMMEFAKKIGWKIQKKDEEEVERFCGEVGVKRQVFKVWMHNNKQLAKQEHLRN